MAIEVFNRYEHKYILDRETYKKIIRIMDIRMEADKYNKNHKPYTIANIYYDTADDYLIRTSLSKPAYKEKLRLRAYGVPNEDDMVFLEIKKKYMGLVNKRRTALKLSESYEFINSGVPPERADYMNGQVLGEIEYFLLVRNVVPKLYLAYDRIAYFERGNPDLRISFDFGIRSRRYDVALELGDYGAPLLEVADDGIGISEENLPKIWERFFRADEARTANDEGNMGLGLAMVKWIAECHGGSISAESTLGKGSVFRLIMPKKR